MCRLSSRRRRGFTLIEAILAVSLTAIIAVLVASGIDFHLRQLTVQRTQIEEAQIARAVMRRIADDLRAAIVYRPADFSTVEELNEQFEDAEALLSGDESTDSSATTDDDIAADISTSAVPSSNPGLFGNQYELQVDVSRIPRYEEFALMTQFGDPGQVGSLSDIKTVSYFLASGQGAVGNGASGMGFGTTAAGTADVTSQGGLARRSMDRATTRYTAENGIFGLLDQNVEVFAPEVTSLQFAYYDGVEWVMEWDSELRGGLPLAVEITIMIPPPDQREAMVSGSSLEAPIQISTDDVYRLVVHLPSSNAQELADAEAAAMGLDSEEGL